MSTIVLPDIICTSTDVPCRIVSLKLLCVIGTPVVDYTGSVRELSPHHTPRLLLWLKRLWSAAPRSYFEAGYLPRPFAARAPSVRELSS